MPACSCWATQPAVTANIAHSTGRQRRDGSRPSGNSKTRKNIGANVKMNATGEIHPTARAAGNDPGATASPRSAYCSVSSVAASESPIRPSSQPMALSGTRLATRRPVPAYTMTASAAMPYMAIRSVAILLVSSPSSTSAAARMSMVNPASDQVATRIRCPRLCLTNATVRPDRSGNVTARPEPSVASSRPMSPGTGHDHDVCLTHRRRATCPGAGAAAKARGGTRRAA